VRILCLALGLLLGCAIVAHAEEKKDEKKKDPPKVVMTIPLAVEVGSTATVKIRGLRLDNASAVRFIDPKAPIDVKIKTKGKSEAPKPLEASKAGDTQVELELKLPADLAAGPVSFVITTPDGETAPYALSILEKGASIQEKEPNGSFRKPQDIELGKTILGQIGEPMDVDVFRFNGKAGQTIVAEIRAAQFGSALDSTLTLYDEAGHFLAGNDDQNGIDSMLRLRLPSDGRYLLTLIDANDRGGAAHPYQLSVGQEQEEHAKEPAAK
jgi:hypothetical protein